MTPGPRRGSSGRNLAVAAGVVLVACVAAFWWLGGSSGTLQEPSEAESRRDPARRSGTSGWSRGGGGGSAGPGASAGQLGNGVDDDARGPRLNPASAMTRDARLDGHRQKSWREIMDETREAFLDKTKYPPTSRPLAPMTDMMVPNHVEPMLRRLKPPGPDDQSTPPKISIRQNQDRVYLKPGDSAVMTLEALDGQTPVAIDSVRARVLKLVGEHATPTPTELAVVFTDDGVPPDATAGDMMYSARLDGSAGAFAGFSGTVEVQIEVRAQGETGPSAYRFIHTAPPPARFTGVIREVVEEGSLSLYVGMEITTPGYFEVYGRLYDDGGAPIAFMNLQRVFEKGNAEAKLVAFGKLLHDEGAKAPFMLRDVEGWRILSGVFPDRELMAVSDPKYRTKPYPLSAFSDKAYTSEQTQAGLKQIDDQIAKGEPLPNPATSSDPPPSSSGVNPPK